MNILECLRVALRGLTNNKMRTALTMLGIIIGVGVVILVVAIGQGATKQVTDTVNSLGTNLLTISSNRNRLRVGTAISRTSVTSTASTSGSGGGSSNRLTLNDAKLIGANFKKTVDAVAPEIDSGAQIRMGSIDANTQLIGTSLDYPYVKNVEVAKGRYFTQEEMDGSLKVCVAGPTIAEHLVGNSKADLTGQTIAVNRQTFQIVGMLAPRGATSWGQDQDDVLIMPVSTAMRRVLNAQFLNQILIRCTTQPMMPLAQEEIATLLRNRHRLAPPYPDNDDFTIRSQTDLLATQTSVTGTMTTLLSSVAIISLVVGGIGIMNIMLVSVTERTREIGIRKAIGATPRDILMQFLIESAIISLLGGLIGIGLGISSSIILAKVAGWNTIVSTTAIFAAVVVSAGVGIFFGIYPASKAAALNPIDALRYE
ncbi:MAG: ABC-type antimicrobial peptide transport system,permease component [Chthonomonadales bacterium]|nr:ABC-type antimicrobial peptide transport system,permease component [Chthonomonadales bacterium]